MAEIFTSNIQKFPVFKDHGHRYDADSAAQQTQRHKPRDESSALNLAGNSKFWIYRNSNFNIHIL